MSDVAAQRVRKYLNLHRRLDGKDQAVIHGIRAYGEESELLVSDLWRLVIYYESMTDGVRAV